MDATKYKILMIEDDEGIAEMLNAYFRVQGYDVHTAHWGEDGYTMATEIRPDLIILDIRLPDIDGFEVARRLRSNRNTNTIPILFLTEKKAREDRLKGLEIGGDDYITKPFDVQELRLRVRNALQRNTHATLTNPVTNLPDGELVDEKLAECLKTPDWGVLMIQLKNLSVFREEYGFVASDDVLRAVSLMVTNLLREENNSADFLCHIGVDQLALFSDTPSLEKYQNELNLRLNQSMEYFYPIKDREKPIAPHKRLGINIKAFLRNQSSAKTPEQLKTELSHL